MSSEGSAPPAKLHHVPALDGIRGAAVLLVLASHLLLGDPNRGLRSLAFKVANGGWIGVDLFFVLSGYLITSILRDALGTPNYFRNFYARRILRIFPLYFGTLFVIFTIVPRIPGMSTPDVQPTLRHQWAAWLYVINFVPLKASGWLFVGHFWSLAIEEQFYLLWPFLLYLAGPRKGRWLAVGGLALSIGSRAVLQVIGARRPDLAVLTTWASFYWTFCRFDGLAVGCLIALIPPAIWTTSRSRRAIVVAGTLITVVLAWLIWRGKIEALHAGPHSFGDRLWKVFGSSLLALFGGFLIIAATTAGYRIVKAIFSNAALRFAGRYSYGMYVIHGILMPWMSARFPPRAFLRWTSSPDVAAYASFACALTIVTVLAVISYELFEKQFLRFKVLFPAASAH